MAAINFCICILMALVGVRSIRADDETRSLFNGGGGFPFFPNKLTGNGGEIPFVPMASNFMPPFLGGSRTKRSPDEKRTAINGSDDEDQHRQLPTTTSLISCDYSDETQRKTQCLSCTQVIRCYRSNLGILRTCRGRLQYCNNGSCSATRGELCDD